MSCAVCTNPDAKALREEWGCEGPKRTPVAAIVCVDCGEVGKAGCSRCDGTGEVPIFECPNRTVPQGYRETLSAVIMVDRGLGLPQSGGTMEQSAWFISAMRYVLPMIEAERARR